MKACVLSTHVKFRHIQEQVQGISMLAPFIAQRATLVDNGIGGEWRMMTMRLHDEH